MEFFFLSKVILIVVDNMEGLKNEVITHIDPLKIHVK